MHMSTHWDFVGFKPSPAKVFPPAVQSASDYTSATALGKSQLHLLWTTCASANVTPSALGEDQNASRPLKSLLLGQNKSRTKYTDSVTIWTILFWTGHSDANFRTMAFYKAAAKLTDSYFTRKQLKSVSIWKCAVLAAIECGCVSILFSLFF